MRAFPAFVSSIAVFAAATAWGQYGLYGSPELLRLQPMAPAANTMVGYPTTSAEGFVPSVPNAQALPPAATRPSQPQVFYGQRAPMTTAPAYQVPARPMVMAPQPYYGAYAGQAPTPAAPKLPAPPAQPAPGPMPAAPAAPAPQPIASPASPSLSPAQPSVVDQMLQEAPGAYAQPALAAPNGNGNGGIPGQACQSCPTAPCGGDPCGMPGRGCGIGRHGRGMAGPAYGGWNNGGWNNGGWNNGGCASGACGAAPCGPAPCGPAPCGVGGYGRGACGVRGYAAGPAPEAGCYGDVAAYGRAPEQCGNDCYGDLDCCAPRCAWYGSVTGLMMGINCGNRVWVTSNSDNEDSQLMHTEKCSDWSGGFELRLGRRFCCDCWSVDAGYWTLDEFSNSQTAPATDMYGVVQRYSTPLDLRFCQFNGVDASLFFDGVTRAPRLSRRDEVHSFDVAVGRNLLVAGCGSCWDLSLKCGPRFFRFEDALQYESWSASGYATWRDRVTNDLWGFQGGIDGAYYIHPRFRLFFGSRFGIYNNHMEGRFDLNGNGYNATVNVPGYQNYPVCSRRDAVAFLTQLDLGADWQFAHGWSARIGYRVVAATGIAYAEHQIPFYMNDTPEIGNIKNNGDLLLHGAFAGLTWNF